RLRALVGQRGVAAGGDRGYGRRVRDRGDGGRRRPRPPGQGALRPPGAPPGPRGPRGGAPSRPRRPGLRRAPGLVRAEVRPEPAHARAGRAAVGGPLRRAGRRPVEQWRTLLNRAISGWASISTPATGSRRMGRRRPTSPPSA